MGEIKRPANKNISQAPLQGYRVLDLTTEMGHLCGKILGDLGADVIKVEKPGGDDSRRRGPFYQDNPHPENSLSWWALNSNKRSVTLDIESSRGRELLGRLLTKSDFLIESYPPGYLDNLRLGYRDLREFHKKLIYVSISPFGQNGPDRDTPASDLTLIARCGWLYLCGDPDRPPVRISLPQAGFNGCAEAAMAALIALFHRETTGAGQQIDVSILQSLGLATFHSLPFYYLNGVILKRTGAYRGGFSEFVNVRQIFPCRDGLVLFALLGGVSGARNNRALVKWLNDEGCRDDYLNSLDWDEFDIAKATSEMVRKIEEPILSFFAARTKSQVSQEVIKRGLMIGIISSVADLFTSPQLQARQVWTSLSMPGTDRTFTVPDGFVKFSNASCGFWKRWPGPGEHNEEIFQGELGLPQAELVRYREAGII